MRKTTVGLLSLALATGVGVGLTPNATASPSAALASGPGRATNAAPQDELPQPLEERRRDARASGLNAVLTGKAKPEERNGSTVVRTGTKTVGQGSKKRRVDQYVELKRESTDRIFVILAEFGNQRHPDYPDQDTDPDTPGPQRFDGPLHNQIPAPDRNVDNSTVWQPNYSADHYRKLYFGQGPGVESLKTYYEKQSSGRYSVNGQVTDWVKVRYNEARYGRSNGYPCDGIVCSNTWNLLTDAANQWVADQKKAGRTNAQIRADLRSFDKWDRYDADGDGNFNEPDGYIDHFQIVHAGGDQADGDPYQGEDAIWSHRWYAYFNNIGSEGPGDNKLGGTEIGNTGLWIGDYTIQPENGGLSVFAHEYGHDLGLPDHYDTAAPGDNPVNWWTLMAQSRVSAAKDQGIGTRPADLGAWDKLQLGWLDYEVAVAGQNKTFAMGPHEYNSRKAQGLVVVLPKKEVTTELGAPKSGAKQWWSDKGDNLDNTLSREVTLPAGAPASLTFAARWDIEDCGPDACDYAFVQVKDGAGDWTSIPGNITKPAEGNGIDGTQETWKDAVFDLSPYAGKTIGLRFRYLTDGAVGGLGFFADDIAVKSGTTTVFSDGAESGANGWTADGFRAVGASVTSLFDHYYIASNRQWVSYDRYLRTGPYNFGFAPERPDYVEHFPYQTGLLVSYWDTSYSDNNTSEHPGNGLVLPIDSHPDPIYRLDGQPWRGRIQTYDAPFSLRRADSFTLHVNGAPSYIRGQAAQPVFDDSRSYWNEVLPRVGVKVPNEGVRLQVLSQNGTSMTVKLSSTK